MQFQRKLRKQTWQNGKKTSFGPDPFGPNLGGQFFVKNLASPVIRFYGQFYDHHVQQQKKLMLGH